MIKFYPTEGNTSYYGRNSDNDKKKESNHTCNCGGKCGGNCKCRKQKEGEITNFYDIFEQTANTLNT